jgi:hypothetical protein
MSRFAFASILLTTSLLLGSSVVIAGDTNPSKITVQQADSLVAFLQGHTRQAKDFSGFPAATPGELDPIMATTGIHCVLPSSSDSLHYESLHAVQYLVGSGATAHRLVFSFTLSPPVAPGQGGTSLALLLLNRQVTQYQVWSSSSAADPRNHVVAFSSRSNHRICEWAG